MKRQEWGKRSGKRYVALLLSALMLLGSLPVFTYAEELSGGTAIEENAAEPSEPSESGPAEPEPPAESGTSEPDAGGESPSEEREHNTDKRGSTDDYRLTASQEEIFTEKGLAVEITAVSTFPFTRNLHIEAKDGGKPEGVKEGDGKATGDPEAASSEASPEENSSDASSSESSSDASGLESSVPEENTSSEDTGTAPEESVSSKDASSENAEESEPEKPGESVEEENTAPAESEEERPAESFAAAAASLRINVVKVLSDVVTPEEVEPLPTAP